MGSPVPFTTSGVLADLDAGLAARADPKTRDWWTRYLRGEARFRGVRMPAIRQVVDDLWQRHDLAAAETAALLDLAWACTERPDSEDKLAGVLLVAEHLLERLDLDHVDDLATPLAAGHLADWNTCDWYGVKVLGPFVAGAPDVAAAAEAVAAWRSAPGLWQRRAAAVAFVDHAGRPEPYPGFRSLLVEVCEANVADPTRWSQTSVGWLLRELAAADPGLVEAFLARHPELSTEARRNARKGLAKATQRG